MLRSLNKKYFELSNELCLFHQDLYQTYYKGDQISKLPKVVKIAVKVYAHELLSTFKDKNMLEKVLIRKLEVSSDYIMDPTEKPFYKETLKNLETLTLKYFKEEENKETRIFFSSLPSLKLIKLEDSYCSFPSLGSS